MVNGAAAEVSQMSTENDARLSIVRHDTTTLHGVCFLARCWRDVDGEGCGRAQM